MDNSAVSALIKTGLAQCESCAFDDQSLFYEPKEPTVHHQECIKDEAINHGQWFESRSTCFSILVKCFFIVHHYGTNIECLLNTA